MKEPAHGTPLQVVYKESLYSLIGRLDNGMLISFDCLAVGVRVGDRGTVVRKGDTCSFRPIHIGTSK
jgi:hypothetical protein